MKLGATVALPVSVAATVSLAWTPVGPATEATFAHDIHVPLFECTSCHEGLTQEAGAPYPDPSFCRTCHDGNIQVRIDWRPPEPRPQWNARFEHWTHIDNANNECTDCHGTNGELPVAAQCRECHVQAETLSSASVVHGGDFRNRHASAAAAAPEHCGTCHLRAECLDCHRPGAATGSPGYHAANFLTEHPTAAYTRSISCGDCHNMRSFCAACHERAGLTSSGGIGSSFHNAEPGFIAGHGQAARQSLESCVACHAENDCLRCHSTFTARVNPHGPGFDAERMRAKNPSMCAACHGANIPGGD